MRVVLDDKWCTIKSPTENEIERIAKTLSFIEEDKTNPSMDDLILQVEEETWEQKLDYFVFVRKDENDLKFLSGLYPFFKENFGDEIELHDFRQKKVEKVIRVPDDYLDGIVFRGYQAHAVSKALTHRRGILDIPTRGGKTEVMAGVAKYHTEEEKPNEGFFLVIVPDSGIMSQTYERFLTRGLTSVGRLGNGYRELEKDVVVCIVDSLYNIVKEHNHEDLERISRATAILVDEVHHLGSPSMAIIPITIPSLDIFVGVSGTPLNDSVNPHSNPSDVAILGLLHKRIFKVSARYLMRKGYIAEPHTFIMGYNFKPPRNFISNWHKVYSRFIKNNQPRNAAIAEIAQVFCERDFSILILVTHIDHGKHILRRITKHDPKALFVYGGNSIIRYSTSENHPKDLPEGWKWHKDKTDLSGHKYYQYPDNFNYKEALQDGTFRIMVGSTVFDEGQDIPDLDGVIIAGGGGKSDVKNTQRPARALTRNDYGNKVFVIDFWDKAHKYTKNHSVLRIESYKRNQYFIHTHGIPELIRCLDEAKELKEKIQNE